MTRDEYLKHLQALADLSSAVLEHCPPHTRRILGEQLQAILLAIEKYTPEIEAPKT